MSSIQNSKLNAELLINFLKNNAWIGKELTAKIHNVEISYNWLNLISPSILEYFNQIEFNSHSSESPNLVTCLDSMTLKIEGMVRDICKVMKISTTNYITDKFGRNIQRELDLNGLLYLDRIDEVFTIDEINLFRFVLVEQVGFNLRNNIAHSFQYFHDYLMGYIHLLIFIILRIGKYDFVQNKAK